MLASDHHTTFALFAGMPMASEYSWRNGSRVNGVKRRWNKSVNACWGPNSSVGVVSLSPTSSVGRPPEASLLPPEA
jgi:hypothetical protein